LISGKKNPSSEDIEKKRFFISFAALVGLSALLSMASFYISYSKDFPLEEKNCKHCGRVIPLSLDNDIYPRDIVAIKTFIDLLDCNIVDKDFFVIDSMIDFSTINNHMYAYDIKYWIKQKTENCSSDLMKDLNEKVRSVK
jgi:hypothetical protein